MPQIEPSQGATLTWDGTTYNLCERFQVQFGAVSVFEVPRIDLGVEGSGANSRVCLKLDAVAVAPPVISATFWGVKPLQWRDAGKQGELALSFPGFSGSGLAFLLDFNIDGAANEYVKTTARFQFAET